MEVSTTEPCHPLWSVDDTLRPSVNPFSETSPRLSKPAAASILVVAEVGSVGASAKEVQAQPPSTGVPVVTRLESMAFKASAMFSPVYSVIYLGSWVVNV